MSKDDKHYFELSKQKSLKLNDKWYLIDKIWYENWCKSVENKDENFNLPKIPNSRLLTDNEINSEVIQNSEYELIPEESWDYLVDKFGLDVFNKELFQRVVIDSHNSLSVEVEPLKLTISIYGKENKVVTKFSRCKTLNDIYEFAKNKFAVTKPLRVLQKMDNGTYDVVKLEGNITIGDAGLSNGEHIFIDYQDTDQQWMNNKLKQRAATKQFTSGGSSRQNDGRLHGVCGLCNLGNTCFMNSAIQCISNVPPLTYYFIKTDWRKDLNVTNPLGMHGRLAERYYQLLEQMWVKGCNYTVPRDFKVEVAKFAPQFSGYAQHDSQELMMFLLDGLHEDLNRIHKKPYQESNDSDDQPIQQKAEEAWKYHKLRNDSVIVENFHGLLKSTVVCPDCKYVSVTFDAFGSLSLPLVLTYPQTFNISLYSTEKKLHKAKILVTKSETVKDFTEKIKEMFPEVAKSFLTVTEIQSHRLSRVFFPQEPISLLKDAEDLMVYEHPVRDCKDEWIQMTMRTNDDEYFGFPVMVPVCKDDIEWFLLKSRIFQRLPFLNQIIDSKSLANNSIDTKLIKLEYEKISPVIKIYLNDKTNQKLHLIDLDPPIKALQSHTRYELVLEWSKEGKDKFYDPKYEIPQSHPSISLQHQPLNIENCVNEFIKTEKLGMNDLWYCKKCKEQKAATKKFDLWQLPKVLILHLKRFRSGSYRRDKIDTFVEFPLTDLDLAKFVSDAHKDSDDYNFKNGDEIYDLVAVSNHMGGLGGGHYTAFAKNFIDDNWYLFDDSHTSRIAPESVQTKTAYVLVYVSKSQLNSTRCSLNQCLNEDSMMDTE